MAESGLILVAGDLDKDTYLLVKHGTEHRTAMEQVANTWRLLAEIMAREIADTK